MEKVNNVDPCFNCQLRHHLCWNDCEMYAAMKRRRQAIREGQKEFGLKWTNIWNHKTKDRRTGKNAVMHGHD